MEEAGWYLVYMEEGRKEEILDEATALGLMVLEDGFPFFLLMCVLLLCHLFCGRPWLMTADYER